MKRCLATLLTFVMVLGLTTTGAWASTNGKVEVINSTIGRDGGRNTVDGNPNTYSEFQHSGSVFYQLPVGTSELNVLASSDVYHVSSGVYQISPGVANFKVSFAKSYMDAQYGNFISTTESLSVNKTKLDYAVPIPAGANVVKIMCTNYENGYYYNQPQLWVYEVSAKTVAPLHKLSVLLNSAETVQLSVTYNLQDNTDLIWKSSNPAVAIVSANGRVTALSEGLAYVYAVNKEGTFKEYMPVRVVKVGADDMRLAMHLMTGQRTRLYLTDNQAQVTWRSLDQSVAMVSSTGVVTGVSPGLAIVQAEYGGELYRIYVRVNS